MGKLVYAVKKKTEEPFQDREWAENTSFEYRDGFFYAADLAEQAVEPFEDELRKIEVSLRYLYSKHVFMDPVPTFEEWLRQLDAIIDGATDVL